MKKRLGIIGFSEDVKPHYNELRRSDYFEVSGVSGCHKDCSCKAEIYDDLNDLLAIKPDVLLISDPIKFAADFSKMAKLCKCVLLCAPIAKNVETIKEIKYCCKSDEVVAGVCFAQRFNQVLVSLKKSLLKEDKIYTINVSKTSSNKEILTHEVVENVDTIMFLSDGEVVGKTKLENRKEGAKNALGVSYQLKLKNGVLANLQISSSCFVNRHCIEVTCESGVYFGDLINLKLYKYTPNGQQNLRVDGDISPLKAIYEQLYTLCSYGKFSTIATLEEAVKVQEICG